METSTSSFKSMTAKRWMCLGAGTAGFTLAWVLVIVGAGGLIWNLFSEPVTATTIAMRNRPLILLIGDSNTQNAADPSSAGWGALLQNSYVRSADVANRGLSGWNTAQFIQHALPNISEELRLYGQPAAITFWFGANDAALADGPNNAKHVPIEQYKQNLLQILYEFQLVSPDTKIILMSPPVVDDDHRRRRQVAAGGPSDPIDRTNEQAGKYAAICGEVAATVPGVTLLDMHAIMMTAYPNATERGALLVDGLHMSASGNVMVYEQVKETLEKLMTAQRLRTPQFTDPFN